MRSRRGLLNGGVIVNMGKKGNQADEARPEKIIPSRLKGGKVKKEVKAALTDFFRRLSCISLKIGKKFTLKQRKKNQKPKKKNPKKKPPKNGGDIKNIVT